MKSTQKLLLIPPTLTILLLTSGCICLNLNQSIDSIKAAVSNKNTDNCDRLEDPIKCICYTSVAISAKDPKICSKIDEQDMIVGCYISVAVEKEDPGICDKISQEQPRDSCITQTAARMKNTDICSRINAPQKRADCTDAVNL